VPSFSSSLLSPTLAITRSLFSSFTPTHPHPVFFFEPSLRLANQAVGKARLNVPEHINFVIFPSSTPFLPTACISPRFQICARWSGRINLGLQWRTDALSQDLKLGAHQPFLSSRSSHSVEPKMVRIGIRWQLAALVLISDLIGLSVVIIATWVRNSPRSSQF
jgi:hypothetical protein